MILSRKIITYQKAYWIEERNGRFVLTRSQNWYTVNGVSHELTDTRDIGIFDTLEDAEEYMNDVVGNYISMIDEADI